MSDLLSAASLLLAILAVLYGMWYAELVKALETPVPPHEASRRKPYREVASVRKTRALPLMLATILLAVVFLPDTVQILWSSVHLAASTPASALRQYNAVATAFVLVELLALCFAVFFTHMWVRMGGLLKDLS